MSCCAVATCNNYSRKTKKLGIDVVYHCFPKDPETAKLWVLKCKRLDSINCKYAHICSSHFAPTDYCDDMKNRLLELPQRKILKVTAVPSLNLPCQTDQNETASTVLREERFNNRRTRLDALERIEHLSPKKPRPESSDISPALIETGPGNDNCNCEIYNLVVEENECLKKTVVDLKKQIDLLRKERRMLFRKISRKTNNHCMLSKKRAGGIKELKQKIVQLKRESIQKSNVITSVNKILTPTQQKALAVKGNVRWTSEDVSRAIMIRALSRKSYDFWRETVGFPLPSAATLSRWCAKFTCLPGVLNNVLTLVSKCCENLSVAEKLCVLSFDEMHIDSKVVYDVGLDQILGPHSKAQVALVRGLVSRWKQPVFFNFDVTMDKSLMFIIINAIESKGIKVCSIVSDLGGCGTLWKELGVSTTSTFFTNPSDSKRKVWVFADMPHYLKLLRNHFLDEGLVLENGTEVNVDILVDVLKKDTGEIKLCHKLEPSFLALKGNERQRVGPAKAVFSRTTAKAIQMLSGNKEVAEFFELVDSFTDVMNSSIPHSSNSHPMRAGFGFTPHFDKQAEVLNKMRNVTSTMRVKNKRSLLPFQKGIIISITSLFGLFEDVREMYDIKYILTTRLTQDALESLFSLIRGTGQFYDHPSPTEFISRIKKIMLANKMPKPSNKTNVTEVEKDSSSIPVYLTAEYLQTAFHPAEVEEICSLPVEGKPCILKITCKQHFLYLL